jgi:hypothetical protein
MTAQLHKLMATAVLGLALASQSLPAWAGTIANSQVSIGYDGSTPVNAEGTLTGARYSADGVQYIRCDVVQVNHYAPDVTCAARDLTGRTVFCASTDPRFADAVKGMTDSSYISFTFTSDGICTDMEVTNASYTLR